CEMPQAALTRSSNDEHGTLRVLHHSRRNAPEEKPVNGGQSFGSHHDQIGMLFRGCLHDFFSWITKLTQRLGRKSRLDQRLHALVEESPSYLAYLALAVLNPRYGRSDRDGSQRAACDDMDHAHVNRHGPAPAAGPLRLKPGQHNLQCF